MKNTLACDGINLEFGLNPVLTNIHITCSVGEIVGLLGRNGSGKSSLLKIIFGSLECSSKSIRINDIPQLKSFSKKIAYLSQKNFIPQFLTLREALKLYGLSSKKLTDEFPLFENCMNQRPAQLSGGLLRLLEVFLVLNLPVPFVLLDEPFSGIMPIHIETLITYLHTKKKEKGIIITDHLYRHITTASDRLYLMTHGRTYHVKSQEQLIELGYVNSL